MHANNNRGKWTLKLMIPVFMLSVFTLIYHGVKRFDRVRGWYQWLIYERELERLEAVQIDGGIAELAERTPRKLVVHIVTLHTRVLSETDCDISYDYCTIE